MYKELKKEWQFATRSGRLFILIMSFLFLALMTPIMLKVLIPEIFRMQFPNLSMEDIILMVNASQLTAVTGFMSDLFELGMIIVVFTLCSIMAQEIRDNTLVFPIVSGNKFVNIIGSKTVFFGLTVGLLVMGSIMICYAYSGILFEFEVPFQDVLYAGMLQGVYFIFIITNLIMWGALLKRALPTGFITLVTAYLMQAVGGLFDIHAYLPSGLIDFSSKFQFQPQNIVTSTLITIVLIIVMSLITHLSMKRMEFNIR
jgi:ABC-2 type transport system permease protein